MRSPGRRSRLRRCLSLPYGTPTVRQRLRVRRQGFRNAAVGRRPANRARGLCRCIRGGFGGIRRLRRGERHAIECLCRRRLSRLSRPSMVRRIPRRLGRRADSGARSSFAVGRATCRSRTYSAPTRSGRRSQCHRVPSRSCTHTRSRNRKLACSIDSDHGACRDACPTAEAWRRTGAVSLLCREVSAL